MKATATFACFLGVFSCVVAGTLMCFGTIGSLTAPSGPNWMAAAIVAWVASGLAAFGAFAISCANAINRAAGGVR